MLDCPLRRQRQMCIRDILCGVRKVFDQFDLISGLHSFFIQENKVYENILPPLSLLNLNDKNKLIEDLRRLNFNFEKLKVASIVQQGELNAIINAKPKEFKQLLNAIIGIDKLDLASEAMRTVNKEFRIDNRGKIGYDDTHI